MLLRFNKQASNLSEKYGRGVRKVGQSRIFDDSMVVQNKQAFFSEVHITLVPLYAFLDPRKREIRD